MLKKDSNMNKYPEVENSTPNQIIKGTQIKGDIQTDGNIRIDGTIIGSVNSKGKVIVGNSGKIDGEILCQSAEISGQLKAKIRISGLLTLKSTAQLNGEIITNKLAIEPGAVFSGNCQMGEISKERTYDIHSGQKPEKQDSPIPVSK